LPVSFLDKVEIICYYFYQSCYLSRRSLLSGVPSCQAGNEGNGQLFGCLGDRGLIT
jgi:hypothetical protein